jgi:hypothetical protein
MKMIKSNLDKLGIKYEICDENPDYKGKKDYITIAFNIAKKFDNLSFSLHSYDPAEVRYYIRIYQYQYYWGEDEDMFMMQWVGKLFAHKDHLKNYIAKYSKYRTLRVAEKGVENYDKDTNEWSLFYAPPLYLDTKSLFSYHGDAKSESYICRDISALMDLLCDFEEFLTNSKNANFETSYPVLV